MSLNIKYYLRYVFFSEKQNKISSRTPRQGAVIDPWLAQQEGIPTKVNEMFIPITLSLDSQNHLTWFCHSQGSHGHGKVMENDWSWKSHGKLLVMEKSWNSVGHGKSHGKPKFVTLIWLQITKVFLMKHWSDYIIDKGLHYERHWEYPL